MPKTQIKGTQVKDESIESVDIASGSIKAGELSSESISGQTLITTTDTTNDRLLIWDATDSTLKQVAPGNLGVGGGGSGSPAGADTQIQFNDGGSFGASSRLTYDDTVLKVIGEGLNPIFALETTENSSAASPIFTLKRNSSTPEDANYLGQIKFLGENDADQEVTYVKISGKIDDASDGSEDGILEFANVKAGSQTITARLRSDSLQLLNSTSLTVDGNVGVGTTSPEAALHVHAGATNTGIVRISQVDNSVDASQLDLFKARDALGTGAPTVIGSSDFIGQVRFAAWDGADYEGFADIYAQAAGTISTTSHPSRIVIRTIKSGTTNLTQAVMIDENQDMTVTGKILGYMRHMTHHRYNDGSASGKEFIPWQGTAEQASPSYITQGVAPYSGRLVKVLLRSSNMLGTTTVGVHKNGDGNTVVNSTAEETVTATLSSSNTTTAFNFSGTSHFLEGEIIGVSVDPTANHGNVNITCVWEYLIRGD